MIYAWTQLTCLCFVFSSHNKHFKVQFQILSDFGTSTGFQIHENFKNSRIHQKSCFIVCFPLRYEQDPDSNTFFSLIPTGICNPGGILEKSHRDPINIFTWVESTLGFRSVEGLIYNRGFSAKLLYLHRNKEQYTIVLRWSLDMLCGVWHVT